ncbi:AAA family ATPase [Comamonas kerstersii]|uniref:AAA family ATPase n=1 Tax=Comamonas kerstersii TaxID=225992 RepID=A0A6A1R0K4_9BURK|nr:AAA family ATPase [Comamonas kerstersii]KAB0585807.1 AAA family ATPase [Comamonas kerstersii]
MQFFVLQNNQSTPSIYTNTAFLTIDRWNDYSFVTQFYLEVFDNHGVKHSIGQVKIGFKGQTTSVPTHTHLTHHFSNLDSNFVSLGQDVDYYKKIYDLPQDLREQLLIGLNDIVYNINRIVEFESEDFFTTSLLRYVSLTTIHGQFSNVLNGRAVLTNYNFKFVRDEGGNLSPVDIVFNVIVGSTPSTNVHAIIGRNGVGKTKILNGMVEIISSTSAQCRFETALFPGAYSQIDSNFFSSLISVSFSAFDPFVPPADQPDPAKGPCYFYVGLKELDGRGKDIKTIRSEIIKSFHECLSLDTKKIRLINAIKTLSSDVNFAQMGFDKLIVDNKNDFLRHLENKVEKMSSGHAVVFLTIAKLIEKVEEKTLIIIDEPEGHLHPPLLSAFLRALSELTLDRNAVAIIATHSPVVLQEIPKSCVWKISRSGLSLRATRPEIETFGENVGILTREVFGLEVINSGFHDLLVKEVDAGGTYESIVNKYNHQLGLEARSLLATLLANKR